MQCIQVDDPSAANYCLTNFTNQCSQKVWVSWRDEGSCSAGCTDYVQPGQRQGVMPHKGRIEWVACFWPAMPRDPGGNLKWRGGQYH
jgi:hypothetical protein